MKVMIVGSGGREHALAWKVAQSPRLERLWIAPGNAGTAALGENVPIRVQDVAGLVTFAAAHCVDLVIVGPEVPLAAGISDAFLAAGIEVFGPTQAAAQIEASKSFAKDFMARHNIPTARYAVFQEYAAACRYCEEASYPLVIKANGLAAGKGVILPDSLEETRAALRAIMIDREFGEAGSEVVIEERLSGPEVSLMAFTDGISVFPMPPAQDHKRLFDGDLGPNTGGMGAYAPAPVCPPELVEEVLQTVLHPTVAGLRAEGRPFVGVLYAGLMLTAQGPRVLEFNCRFGDPETQVVIPLLETDILEIAQACCEGRLADVRISWKSGGAVCVVAASAGYPAQVDDGKRVSGLDHLRGAVCFHAGTQLREGQVISAGGRVLGFVGQAASLKEALDQAYAGLSQVFFDGMQFRKDIGHQALALIQSQSAYARAGVNIAAGDHAVQLMSAAVKSTYTPQVLAGIGSFGGMLDISLIKEMRQPVLVASIDGVGTKVILGAQAGRYHGLGMDMVNHSINDILVQGARPLFFLDYYASPALQPSVVAEVVTGMSQACREAGCVLLGGETAEMPGVYQAGEFDIAGAIVGFVERDRVLPRRDLLVGDYLVGLSSSGPHTNGFSLLRKVFAGVDLQTIFPEIGIPLGDALLAPHRSYLNQLWPALQAKSPPIKALAHLTGGGFLENIPRILPEGLRAVIQTSTWQVPPLFRLVQQRGGIEREEMYRVFNMGIGMVAVVSPVDLADLRGLVGEDLPVIGYLERRPDQAERVVLQ